MIRILGTVLNISFQTELLIMTLLGLTNSTLDWKPFELVSQLSVIDELHFPARSDGEISGNFISWIKKLLTFTVVVQFFCSLLNPLAYLLKLYPIITWSRADILLPWLAVHALNTILPKLMSLVIAFVFYFESMISTVTLLEFLLVETINLLIAWCNWYLFFDFYMDLRTIENNRQKIISQNVRRRLRESVKSSYTLSSSIPNLKLEPGESSAELSELRPVRSLEGLVDHPSRSLKYTRNSVSTSSSYETLTPAEKTIKILNLTDDELQSARVRKGSLNKVLSNADTVDVELIDLVSPDEISFVSLANTDESVIIVYDSQDEKELEKILAPVEKSEHEQEASNSHRKGTISDIADEDLLLELLDVENLVDEAASMDLPQEEQLLENRKSDSSRDRSPRKTEAHLFEEERLSGMKKSSLLDEERSSKSKKRHSSRQEELFEVQKLEVSREEKLFKMQRPGLPRNDDEFRECVCSSSEEDDDDEENEAPANARPENFLKRLPLKVGTIRGDDLKPKEQYYAERKKTKNKSVQTVDYPEIPLNTLLLSPSTAIVPRGSNQYVKSEEKDLHCLLNENFQFLDKMCRAMNFSNNQSIPNNNLRKWLIFRHQLESSLDQNAFLKKNGSMIDLMKPRPIGYFRVKDKNTQTEATLKAKKRHKEKHGTLLHYPKTEVIESKWNYVENFPGTSTDMIGKSFPSHQVDKSVEPSKISDASDKMPHFIDIVNFSKTTSTSHTPVEKKLTKPLERPISCDDREKTNISILKTKVPMKSSELDYFDGQKVKDLRNLQAYNKLTLEQDKRELMQKKKKSKMTSYKNAVTELTLRNSDVVPNRPVKVDNRTCKSNHSRVRNTTHSPEPRNRNFNQLFRYNEKLFDQPAETQEITKNPEYQYLETESCKDKTVPSTNTTVLSVCRSNTKIPPHLRKAAEGLEEIDWLDPSSDSANRFKSSQAITPSEADGPWRSVIVDDETVSALKCAFSFSDESDRGFQLGPEMREPYPIFQVVALSMAEIFKATGWRNFEESLPENLSDAPLADVIICEAELDCDVSDEVVDVLDELIKAGEEELERRKCLSVSLLEQLHELLKSSRETMSEDENYRSHNDLDDRLDFFHDLCINDGNVGDDVKPVETCVYTMNEQIISNPLREPRESMSMKNLTNQKSESPTKMVSQNAASLNSGRNSSATRNNRDSARTGAEAHSSRIYKTKFENRVQKHHCRKGEGLSSGNVMEFDSEGRALNSMNCPSDEKIAERESTDEMIKTFNTFCDTFMETEAGNIELEKNLKTLAKSEKFSKLMSLFEEADLKVFKEKMSNEEDEVVLSTSDFASCETMREAFVGSGKEERPIAVDVKKENPAKSRNQEYDIASAFTEKHLDLPSADIGIPYSQKLKNHREYLESDDIKQRILNWRNESVDSMNSLDYPKKRKLKETHSFSDSSDIEEFERV